MKRTPWIPAALAAALALSACGVERPGAPVEIAAGPSTVPGRLLVKVADDAAAGRAEAAVGARRAGAIASLGVVALEVPAEQAVAARERLAALPGVLYVEPDPLAHALARKPKTAPTPTPTPGGATEGADPLRAQQWGLDVLGAEAAWAAPGGAGSAAVRVAILDTGLDQDHEDLDPLNRTNGSSGKIVGDADFTGSSVGADDAYGHGTHCAGIAAAVAGNARGVAGLGGATSLLNGKVLNDRGSGSHFAIAAGIDWAVASGAKVISMSLGSGLGSQTLEAAVNRARDAGVLVVAAAGNSGTAGAIYPARYDACVAVAATDSRDAKASFSNHGAGVDVAAPGVGILSTLPNHRNRVGGTGYGSLSGTSMATPFVAGLAALVWAQNPTWTAAQVRARIESTCDRVAGTGTYWTHGRVHAGRALGAP